MRVLLSMYLLSAHLITVIWTLPLVTLNQPASGAHASILGEEYWPEGTTSRVRDAHAPEPTGGSAGSPSFGKNPGSRRKKYKTSVAAYEISEMSTIFDDAVEAEPLIDGSEDYKDLASEFIVYQTETEEEELTVHAFDKKLGLPHPFIDLDVKKTIQVVEFMVEVSDLKTQLVHQGANINKLMTIMTANGMNI